jgi:hypothetical protein
MMNNNKKNTKQKTTFSKTTSKKPNASTSSTKNVKLTSQKIVSDSSNKEIIAPSVIVKTEEELHRDKMAIRIQTSYRAHLARKKRNQLKNEKIQMEKKLKDLEQEAYLQSLRIYQEAQDKKRMKQLKEKQLMQKRETRRKKFLEKAFDGDLQVIRIINS